ncbi:MAG: mechanosensitive ion channel family protein [Ruminococcaceae bacterium]|nr:mechanosensitive ion channel family protein [Oscillospiraceae bacterium]
MKFRINSLPRGLSFAPGWRIMLSVFSVQRRNQFMIEEIRSAVSLVTLGSILPTVLLVVVGVFAIKAILALVDKSMSKTRLEKAATSLIRSLLKVVLYVLLGLMVASKLGIDVTGVVALASVASLALSLSLQDALSNVIGGFTLLSNHPFHSGDYVEIAGQGGTVQTIDITYTKLTTADNKTISIPNSAVVASQIVNYSTSGTRRVDIPVTASYDAPIETVKEAILRAARVDTVIDTPAAPFVGLKNYGESSIEYVLQVWTKSGDYWKTLFTINENIKREFDEAGVEMTYPHLNVHLDK